MTNLNDVVEHASRLGLGLSSKNDDEFTVTGHNGPHHTGDLFEIAAFLDGYELGLSWAM